MRTCRNSNEIDMLIFKKTLLFMSHIVGKAKSDSSQLKSYLRREEKLSNS